MKNRILVAGCLLLLSLSPACNIGCAGKKIHLGLIYANKNDSIRIIFDEELIVDKVIGEYYNGHFRSKEDRLAIPCLNKDSVHVKVKINARDTSFYFHPKEIKELYIGCSIKGYVQVYYNYERGGLREYDPMR